MIFLALLLIQLHSSILVCIGRKSPPTSIIITFTRQMDSFIQKARQVSPEGIDLSGFAASILAGQCLTREFRLQHGDCSIVEY